MKTIFIPVFSHHVARSTLRTNIARALGEAKDVRVVVFVPNFKREMYQEEFSDLNVLFEGVAEFPKTYSALDRFFHRLSLFYFNTRDARFRRKRFLYHERKQMARYVFSLCLLFVLSRKPLRKMFRKLDFLLIRDERLAHYFDTYQPDIVFSANMTNQHDLSFLRHAKQHGTRTVGMIKSWDNITIAKYPFRLSPDTVICHSRPIRRDVTAHLDCKEEHTHLTGIPHFDLYVTKSRSSRETFCARLGIDPAKRIVLFASVSRSNPTEAQVATLIDTMIRRRMIPQDVVVIFRYHPSQKTAMPGLPQNENIIVDDSKSTLDHNGPFSEILSRDMEHLADSLHHAELLITTGSTMAIDGSAFDKPVIDIGFDGFETRPFHDSIRRTYTPHKEHYYPIARSRATTIVYSADELAAAINRYLKDPALHRKERQWIVDEYCYRFDGKSSERIAHYVLSRLPE